MRHRTADSFLCRRIRVHSLADGDLSLQILCKTPQAPVVRKPINAKLRIKSKVLFSLVEKVFSNFTLNVQVKFQSKLKGENLLEILLLNSN